MVQAFQYFNTPIINNFGEQRKMLRIAKRQCTKNVPHSPAYFTINSQLPPNCQNLLLLKPGTLHRRLNNEFQWFNHVSITETPITWSTYHAFKNWVLDFRPNISALLPLLPEQAHSVATMEHAMQKVKETTSYLRLDQVPVVTVSHPLFAVAKQIEWQWHKPFGEDKFVVILGGLHIIEMAAFKTIGNLLKESMWTAVLTEAQINKAWPTGDSLRALQIASMSKRSI